MVLAEMRAKGSSTAIRQFNVAAKTRKLMQTEIPLRLSSSQKPLSLSVSNGNDKEDGYTPGGVEY